MEFDRSDGVFCHVTSLPGPYGIGDLGPGARSFLGFLDRADVDFWQICPIGPTVGALGDSPYQSYSAFAGNPLLISPDPLVDEGWLTDDDVTPVPDFDPAETAYDRVRAYKLPLLRAAFDRFETTASRAERNAFDAFRDREPWVEAYALFRALSDARPEDTWTGWPAPLRDRDPDALADAREEHAHEVRYREFTQWTFDRQWAALKAEANDRGIRILGDVPIYVALDSADVWASPEAFRLDGDRRPTAVAGVPPNPGDAGQRWGNPLYDWETLSADDYGWWIRRLRRVLDLADAARLDHFLGFFRYWAIPNDAGDPADGEWCEAPGEELFEVVADELDGTPFVAEDLGFGDPRADATMREFGLPGMRVPHYADWCREGDDHQPMQYPQRSVGYTSTHDTDTWVGFYDDLGADQRDCLHYNLGVDGERPIEWEIVDAVWGSEAVLAVTTVQDLLGLGSEARFNTPGTAAGNWRWRVEEDRLTGAVADRLRQFGEFHVR